MVTRRDSTRPATQKIATIFGSSASACAPVVCENALAKMDIIDGLRRTGEDTIGGGAEAQCELGLTCYAICASGLGLAAGNRPRNSRFRPMEDERAKLLTKAER